MKAWNLLAFCRKKKIEKTILRILGWCAFSHSLDPTRTCALISLVQKSPGRCRGFESQERLIEIRIDVQNATSWPLEGIATTS